MVDLGQRVESLKNKRRDAMSAGGTAWIELPDDAMEVRWTLEWSNGALQAVRDTGHIEDCSVNVKHNGGHNWFRQVATSGDKYNFLGAAWSSGIIRGRLLRTDPGTWTGGTKAFHGAWSGFVNYSSNGDPASGGGNWHMMRGRVSTADASWWGFSCTNGPLTLCVEWSGYPR